MIYAIGLPWLYHALVGFNVADPLQATLKGGLYPFLIGDAIKAILAAVILPVVWRIVGANKNTAAE